MKKKLNLLCLLVLIVIAFLIQFRIFGYIDTWRIWQVFPIVPSFNDTRGILVWADVYGSEIDPTTYDPPSPTIPSMNYPRIWKYVHHLGLGEKDTEAVAIVLIALFAAGLLIGLPPLTNTAVGCIAAAVLSPAVLLGIERGNIDLLLFFMLALSVVWVNTRVYLAWAAVVLAFEMKLYPIFGLMVLIRKRAMVFIGLMLVALAYVSFRTICNVDELSIIAAVTPRSTIIAYGVRILAQVALASCGPLVSLTVQALSYAVVAATILLSFRALARSQPGFLTETDSDPRRLNAFRMGSAIFLGTFLIGNNWDYRLLFMIFTIPQLLDWRHHVSRIVSGISLGTLVATYLALWHIPIVKLASLLPYGMQTAYFLNQAFHYAIFSGLAYLFVLSMPEYVGAFTRRVHAGIWKTS